MTEANATPKPIRRSRPTKYPARLAIMLTQHQRDGIDAAAADRDEATIAPVVRDWLALGRDLEEALRHPDFPDLGERVEALRREAGTSRADALARLLDFATREAVRRRDRNAALVPFDGVEYGTASVDLRG